MTNARTIAVAGKGGVGKTTVAALIIKVLRQQAHELNHHRLKPVGS